MSPHGTRPLGVFDSGLGGLTVVRSVASVLPAEPMVYFGDTARLPYGNKSARTVTRLSLEALWFLEHFGIKALIVACNSASALAIDALRDAASVPVLGVVEAGARRAMETTRTGRVGVIGTRGTIGSGCYERALSALDASVTTATATAPLFVPLVEEGWIDHAVTRAVAREYLTPLIEARVDTLVLGCTHYPLLARVIGEVMGDTVTLIDSGDAVAVEAQAYLGEHDLLSRGGVPARKHRFFVSDQPDRFDAEGRRFLGDALMGSVESVDQSDLPWYNRAASPESNQPQETP